MSYEIHNVQRIRVWSESTFASDHSGTTGDFTDVPIREGTAQMTLTRDSLDPQQMVQSRVEYREEVLGKRSATLSFTVNLAPTGTAAVTATSAVTGALGTLLKAVMGGENKAAGSTSAAGSTTTVINVQTGHGSRFAVGGVIGWRNSSNILEVREIESISTDAITLKYALSASPSTSDAIYNAATYYLTEDPSESLQFIVEGAESDDRWLLLGGQCVGGMQIALDPSGQQLPSVTFNFTFANWLDSNETSGSLTGTIETATYSNYEPIVGHAGEFRCLTVAAATLSTSTLVHCSTLAFNPSISYVPITSPSGTNTVLRWRASRAAPPAEGQWTSPFQSLSFWSSRNSKTDKALFYQMGTVAGSTVVISAPTVQIVNPQRVADGSQIAAETISWKARRDTDVGASTTELAKSPWRIHLV